MECPDGDKRREQPLSWHGAAIAVVVGVTASFILTTGRRFRRRRGGGTGLEDRLGILGAPSNDVRDEHEPDAMGDDDDCDRCIVTSSVSVSP